MKVLVATHSYSGNGAAVMLLSIIRHWIQDLGWSVDVLFKLEDVIPDELAETGANLFPHPDPSEYDFALVNTLVSAPYAEAFAGKVRTILWVHEGETVLWNTAAPALALRQVFQKATKVIFQSSWQSESVYRSFLYGLDRDNVACVRNGMPALPPNLGAKPKSTGRRRVVFVGGIYGRKRPVDLVRAVLGLDSHDVECVFVGMKTALETLGEEGVALLRSDPSRFVLVGELTRRETLEYVASADVFCLPSGDESQPIAPLEAAALGVPCLLSDLPPYQGIWKHGVNCLTHQVGNVDLLRWNLRILLDDTDVVAHINKGASRLVESFGMSKFFARFDAEIPV